MTMKNIVLVMATGLLFYTVHVISRVTNLDFFDWGSNHTGMRIRFTGVRSKGEVYPNTELMPLYPNTTIIIQKDRVGNILVNHLGDLQSIENAFMTGCSGFKVVEHGANKQNEALCEEVAILKAYQEFVERLSK